ncbi:nucleoporin-interacting protein [Bacillus spongiae]|uniref:Nucleoporin-interacting protein n=1 Tax=Bacillus spongiae TaxID=2683610 RepID=A0ABU8H8K0_9BACI
MKTKGLIGVLVIYWIMRLSLLSPLPATWDEVDFVLGVVEYDLLKMQPHFPGYPFFILGGMVMSYIIESPEWALLLFIQILCISTIVPQYKMASLFLSKEKSWLLTVAVQTLAYPTLMMSLPMSEGAAISILWWYIWFLFKALEENNRQAVVWSIVLYSILLGTRLSYIPFGIGLIYLFYRRYIENKSISELAFYGLIACISQLVWVTALIANVGSIKSFLDVATGFTSGHFQDWGGAVSADTNIVIRFLWYVFHNIIWNGLFSTSLILAGVSLVAFIFVRKRKPFLIGPAVLLFVALYSCYFLWGFFAQNIDKPRHILPLIVLGVFGLHVLLLKFGTKRMTTILVFQLVLQGIIGIGQLVENKNSKPAVYQVANTLEKKDVPTLLYTWEETRVFEYIDVTFEHKRVFTYSQFLQDSKRYPNHDIYVTNAVINGFEQQGVTQLDLQFERIEHFSSFSLRDPIYSEITLYQLKEKRGDDS